MIQMPMILVVCGALLAPAAWGGPPFVTDDPEVPPPGGWEIDVPFVLQREPGRTEMQAPLLDLNYGLPNMELTLLARLTTIHKDGGDTVAGPADLLIDVKWRFWNDEKHGIQLAVYPQLLVPTGERQRDLGEGHPEYALPLLAEKQWDKWTLYGSAGYWWRPAGNAPSYWYSGAVLNRQINDWLELGVELFGNMPVEFHEPADFGFNVGGTWKLSDHVNLLFTAGRDIFGDISLLTYFGAQIVTE